VSRSLSRVQAVLLGLVVLGGLALGAVGLFAVGSRQWLWGDTFHLQVGFPQVRGVEAGTKVRVKGMNAGEVEAVQPPAAPGGPVLVRLRLDGQFRSLVRADATAQIVGEGMIGSRVVEITPGSDAASPVHDGATIASRPSAELGDVVAQIGGVVDDLRANKGSLERLINGVERMTHQGTSTLESIQQDADAIKRMPIVRSYVQDARALLIRPECERYRQAYRETELFEPGKAILTAQGRQRLDALAPWLDGLKHKGSDVVVASYAANGDAALARDVTQKQSEAVVGYLKDNHAVQKMGWFSSRKVRPIGLGTGAAPQTDAAALPAPRIEVLVFVPRG
jgi:phospholipid/cholesterol/gamma-HCH transport system substrate-binding protein